MHRRHAAISGATRSVALAAAALLVAATILGGWWGGRLIGLGWGPNRSDRFPFFPVGGAGLLIAASCSATAWRLVRHALGMHGPGAGRFVAASVALLPGVAGIGVALGQFLADGIGPLSLFRNALPDVAVALLLLGVGLLVRAAARPPPTRNRSDAP